MYSVVYGQLHSALAVYAIAQRFSNTHIYLAITRLTNLKEMHSLHGWEFLSLLSLSKAVPQIQLGQSAYKYYFELCLSVSSTVRCINIFLFFNFLSTITLGHFPCISNELLLLSNENCGENKSNEYIFM